MVKPNQKTRFRKLKRENKNLTEAIIKENDKIKVDNLGDGKIMEQVYGNKIKTAPPIVETTEKIMSNILKLKKSI